MKDLTSTVILIAAIVILISFLFRVNNSMYTAQEIPKKIWTFWDSDEIPPFVQKCINTWRVNNPDYEVNVLNNDNLTQYLDQEEVTQIKNWKHNTFPQRMSDLVRLALLAKYGGVWMDASIICNKSLNWIQGLGSCIMYSLPHKEKYDEPVLENWFIACTENNQFIKELNSEFRSVGFMDIKEYTSKENTEGVDDPYYLLMYVCAKKVYRKYPEVTVLDADGPYRYHLNGGVKSLLTNNLRDEENILKFRKDDRAEITPEIEKALFD